MGTLARENTMEGIGGVHIWASFHIVFPGLKPDLDSSEAKTMLRHEQCAGVRYVWAMTWSWVLPVVI